MAYPTKLVSVTKTNIAGDRPSGLDGGVNNVDSGNVSPEAGTGGVGQSSNGRYIVFSSEATNFGAIPESNSSDTRDIFLKDMVTGNLTRVTTGGTGPDSSDPDVSDDGRYVTYQTNDSVYRYDAQSNISTQITGNGADPHMSADGRYITFNTPESGGVSQVYLKDMQTGTTVLISVEADGVTTGNNDSSNAYVSNDGNFVVFESLADNFSVGNANLNKEIYLKNIATGALTRVSENAQGGGGATDGFQDEDGLPATLGDPDVVPFPIFPVSTNASISGNGRYVVFQSSAEDFIDLDKTINSAIYRKDLITGDIQLVTEGKSGADAVGGTDASISADGRFVLFKSGFGSAHDPSINTVASPTSPMYYSFWYVKDMANGDVYNIDLAANGLRQQTTVPGFGTITGPTIYNPPYESYNATISADGKYITLSSTQSLDIGKVKVNTIVTGDETIVDNNDGQYDVFRIDISSIASQAIVAQTRTGTSGNDTLIGGDGKDKLVGLDGDDTYRVELIQSGATATIKHTVVEAAGKGTDTIEVIGSVSGLSKAATITIAANVEHLDASATGSTLLNITGNALTNVITGNDAANVINGLAGSDILNGGNGDDTLDGGAEGDTIEGGDGNDSLIGGLGQDALIGGDGNDTYVVNLKTVNVGGLSVELEDNISEYLNKGIDTLKLTGAAKLASASLIALDGDLANIDNIDASATGTTLLNLTGNGLANYLTGNAASNTLIGYAGNDTLDGGAGADSMDGGAGDDTYIVDNVGDIISELPSIPAFPVPSTSGHSHSGSLTADGQYLVFSSEVPNLVSNDGNIYEDVFIRNLNTGDIQLISNNVPVGYSYSPSVSADGRFVAFLNDSSVDATRSILVKDLQTGDVQRVDTDASGNASDNSSYKPLISADGHYVVFESYASNLIENHIDTNASLDIYLKDLQTNEVKKISTDSAGNGGSNPSFNPVISPDSQYVMFESDSALVEGDTNNAGDIYLKNILTGEIQRVNTDVAGNQTQTSSISWHSSFSPDGRYVLFESNAQNLVPGTPTNNFYTYIKNLETGQIERFDGFNASLSPDGNSIVFVSSATNLVSNDTNGQADIFVKNLTTGEIVRVNTTSSGGETYSYQGGYPYNPKFSPDGKSIIFMSYSDNLVPGNPVIGYEDIFLKNLETGAIQQISGGDIVWPAQEFGIDTVKASTTYKLSANVENLILTGVATINGTGNGLNNHLAGNNAANVLDGRAGADIMVGGAGNDTYIVDDEDDVVIETDSNVKTGGTDTIKSSVSFTLSSVGAANVEHLTLTGTADDDISGFGNVIANTITGNDGDNLLYGGGGTVADTLIGGKGSDTYRVDLVTTGTVNNTTYKLKDTITESAVNPGDTDTVVLFDVNGISNKVSTITLGANLENLNAVATGNASLNLTGNTLNNEITGNSAANLIQGLAGADFLLGGFGNDTLDGGLGVDTLIGGIDNDIYVVNITTATVLGVAEAQLEDTIIELADEGDFDTLNLTGTAKLSTPTQIALSGDLAEIEGLDISGTKTTLINLIGNASDNLLIGNAAANTLIGNEGDDLLDGGLGNDSLVGGDGNDYYIVNAAGDIVDEAGTVDSDNDFIEAGFSIDLADYAGIESIVLTGNAALSAKGNEFSNQIVGNGGANKLEGFAGGDLLLGFAGNDTLDGGEGADIMDGGAGNDLYLVDDVNDLVIESFTGTASGTDTIKISATYNGTSREADPEVENIDASLFTDDIYLRGNESANMLTGGSGDDELDGFEGVDTLKGGLGDDLYSVDLKTTGTGAKAVASLEDSLIEVANQGRDKIELFGDIALTKASTITLAANFEDLDGSNTNLTLLNFTGNAVDNVIIGNDANNTILGLAGDDELYGNGGDDSLNGGAGDDIINGGDGNDSLDGGAGTDALDGGEGDDTYFVDIGFHLNEDLEIGGYIVDLLDQVNDTGSALDTDTLMLRGKAISVSNDYSVFTFIEGIEKVDASLVTTAIDLFGNELDNIAIGNSFSNYIDGFEGNDWIDGAKGNDFLFGAEGDDTIIGGDGNDTLQGSLGADSLTGGAGKDTFLYLYIDESAAGSGDVIADFNRAQGDKIDLSFDVNDIEAEIQAFTFIGAEDFSEVAGELRFSSGILSGDINGDGMSDFEIMLTGVTSLVASDLILS